MLHSVQLLLHCVCLIVYVCVYCRLFHSFTTQRGTHPTSNPILLFKKQRKHTHPSSSNNIPFSRPRPLTHTNTIHTQTHVHIHHTQFYTQHSARRAKIDSRQVVGRGRRVRFGFTTTLHPKSEANARLAHSSERTKRASIFLVLAGFPVSRVECTHIVCVL